jgi:hypothetical protein
MRIAQLKMLCNKKHCWDIAQNTMIGFKKTKGCISAGVYPAKAGRDG